MGIGSEMLGSRSPSSQGSVTLPSDIPALPQCLPVDPITLGNQKNPRSGELRRVLGVPYGSMTEDHSFGVSQLKPPPPVATEELKHFKESVHDSTRKARCFLSCCCNCNFYFINLLGLIFISRKMILFMTEA